MRNRLTRVWHLVFFVIRRVIICVREEKRNVAARALTGPAADVRAEGAQHADGVDGHAELPLPCAGRT